MMRGNERYKVYVGLLGAIAGALAGGVTARALQDDKPAAELHQLPQHQPDDGAHRGRIPATTPDDGGRVDVQVARPSSHSSAAVDESAIERDPLIALSDATRDDVQRVEQRFEYLDDILRRVPRDTRYERDVEWAVQEYGTAHESLGIVLTFVSCGPTFCRVEYSHASPDAIQRLVMGGVQSPIFSKQGVQLRRDVGDGTFSTTHFVTTGDERLPEVGAFREPRQ